MIHSRNYSVLLAALLLLAVTGLAPAQMPACPMAAAPGGAGAAVPRETQRAMLQTHLKFIKDNAGLMSGLMQKRIELQLLLVDSVPNMDQVAAKLTDINKDETQLQTRMLEARIATMKTMPVGMRGHMMGMMGSGMGCPMMGGMMGAGMGMGSGPGMGCPMMGSGMMQGMPGK